MTVPTSVLWDFGFAPSPRTPKLEDHTVPRNTTTKKGTKPRLSAAEMTAIQHLMSGSSVTAAAEAAGVDRTTLHRWMRHKVHFREALDQNREDLQATFDARLTALVDVAIDGLKGGVLVDPKTALAFLEKSGLLQPRRSSEVADGSDTTAN